MSEGRARAGDVLVAGADLSDEAVARIVAARTDRGAAAAADAAGAQMLICTIGEEHYAVPMGEVWRVLPRPRVTRVPGAPAALLGVFSNRGVVHNLFDPAVLLGSTAGNVAGAQAVVLRQATPRLALAVDAVPGIVALAGAGPPGQEGSLTHYAATTDGTRVSVIDVPRLVASLLDRSFQS